MSGFRGIKKKKKWAINCACSKLTQNGGSSWVSDCKSGSVWQQVAFPLVGGKERVSECLGVSFGKYLKLKILRMGLRNVRTSDITKLAMSWQEREHLKAHDHSKKVGWTSIRYDWGLLYFLNYQIWFKIVKTVYFVQNQDRLTKVGQLLPSLLVFTVSITKFMLAAARCQFFHLYQDLSTKVGRFF